MAAASLLCRIGSATVNRFLPQRNRSPAFSSRRVPVSLANRTIGLTEMAMMHVVRFACAQQHPTVHRAGVGCR